MESSHAKEIVEGRRERGETTTKYPNSQGAYAPEIMRGDEIKESKASFFVREFAPDSSAQRGTVINMQPFCCYPSNPILFAVRRNLNLTKHQ